MYKNVCFYHFRLQHTWIKPKGYDSGIQIYNCISKIKEPLILENKNIIKWYACGPTVYDSAHIGHACCYMKTDIIQNILRNFFQNNVVNVMNITDIDDKIIKRSKELKIPCTELAQKYEDEFWNDMMLLGVHKPLLILRVTENIDLIKDFIRKLLDDNFAYKAKDESVYFDVSKISSYGKLQNVGSNPDDDCDTIKKSSVDFALWKKPKHEEPYWESDWGPGRPGWHIECSAMAGAVFGPRIDIHSGGIDLRFPHHENEEAQSCAYFSQSQWVNYWLHIGHLHSQHSEKMSKSLKNTIGIPELLKKCTSETFRFACIMSHYRSPMEYSDELLKSSENVLNKYKFLISDCQAYLKGTLVGSVNPDILVPAVNESLIEIRRALADDFDTPSVVKALNALTATTNKMLHSSSSPTGQHTITNSSYLLAVQNIIIDTLSTFGVNLNVSSKSLNEESELKSVMNILSDFRQNVRNLAITNKDHCLLQLCDDLRGDLKKCGITINDHGKRSVWLK